MLINPVFHQKWNISVRIINKLLKVGLALALLGALSVALLYAYFKNELPTEAELRDVRLQTPMQIYSQEGLLISQYGEKKRIPLTLDQIPKHMINAVLDTEDSRFYSHNGIDFIGLTRAVIKMVTSSKRKQGASTITMQLARNMHLTRDRTITRKIKEVFVALHIESLFSKDEILALYLNKIELGHRSFGVGAAAQVYYGKDINELTLAQIATIAGLPKAPSTLNPISRPERSKNRRAVVLGRMLAMGNISEIDYRNAKNAPVTAKRHGVDIKAPAPYVAAMVNQWMLEQSGLDDVYTNGYKVYTTIPWNLQKAAQDAVVNNLHNYDERHGYRTAKLSYLWEEPELEPLSESRQSEQSKDENLAQNEQTDATQSPAWNKQQVTEHLAKINQYGDLIPAVVMSIGQQDAQVLLKDGKSINLDWQNLKWAKPYINDSKHGRSPKTTSDIFKPGARIWVRKQDNGLYRLAQLPGPSGALVAIDPKNGALRSIVGGYSYYLSQYNRATQAKRQVGSNIKPFIYSAALDHGHTLASLIMDAPIHQWDEQLGVAWRPRNSPPIYDGPTRIRVALAKSKNVVSVRLLKGIGLRKAVDHITKFGIPADELPLNDSLALGSASLTPLQVAAGTSSFANGGFLIEPYVVERVVDADERVIYQANPMVVCKSCETQNEQQNSRINATNGDQNEGYNASQYDEQLIPAPRVISEQNAFLIAQAMTSTIWGGGDWRHKTGWNGTGWRATRKLKRRDLSGKTGTTNDAKDTWFSGFSNQLMVTTWVGFDNPSRALGRSGIGSESGGITAQPAWNDFMVVALKDKQEQTLQIPENIISVRIDQKTGLLATKNDHTSRFEYFLSGTEPDKYATSDETPEVIDNDGQGKVTDEEEIF